MPRRQKVGTGITRHERVIWDMLDPAERELADKELESFIWPPDNFSGWLDQREARLAKILEHFRLPAPNRLVAYDNANPRLWRYEDDPNTSGPHARTEWYLQAFPYQSSFWFIGRILLLINRCRSAVREGGPEKAAGCALQLGTIDGVFNLKFSGEKRLADYERHQVIGSNKANNIKRRNASAWKAEARRIIAAHPAIDLDNATAAAHAILAAWPDHSAPKPSKRTLRAYLPTLAKRDVLPDLTELS